MRSCGSDAAATHSSTASAKQRPGVDLDDPVDDGPDPLRPDRKLVAMDPQVADPGRQQLVDGGREQRLARREMVLGGTARHPGPLGYDGDGRGAPPELTE